MSASDPRALLIEMDRPVLLSSISHSLSTKREDTPSLHLKLVGKAQDALHQNPNPMENNDSDIEIDYFGNSEEDMEPDDDRSLI